MERKSKKRPFVWVAFLLVFAITVFLSPAVFSSQTLCGSKMCVDVYWSKTFCSNGWVKELTKTDRWECKDYESSLCGRWGTYQTSRNQEYCSPGMSCIHEFYCKGSQLRKKSVCTLRGCKSPFFGSYICKKRSSSFSPQCYLWEYGRDAYCFQQVFSRADTLVRDCGRSNCGRWTNYCKGEELWRKRTCTDKGCRNDSCYSFTREQRQKLKDCPYDCRYNTCIKPSRQYNRYNIRYDTGQNSYAANTGAQSQRRVSFWCQIMRKFGARC